MSTHRKRLTKAKHRCEIDPDGHSDHAPPPLNPKSRRADAGLCAGSDGGNLREADAAAAAAVADLGLQVWEKEEKSFSLLRNSPASHARSSDGTGLGERLPLQTEHVLGPTWELSSSLNVPCVFQTDQIRQLRVSSIVLC